jgi:uncharacterized protein YoaH (UPF0181 family)
MARQQRSVSDDYVNKLKVIATKVLDDWEKSPSSYSECNIQKITLERWKKGDNLPSIRSIESFLKFLRLTQKRFDEYLDDKIDFDTFWSYRGKELEDRVITQESVVNDARTLTHSERMWIIQELAKITTDTIEKVELFSLDARQLKRLKTLLTRSRYKLGDDKQELDTETFQKIINEGVSKNLIISIVAQKIQEFPKKEFDKLATFLLKPDQWIGDDLIGVSDQKMNSYEDLISALT